MLFFHRSLHCLVAMELKVGKFKPKYVSKMDFYLEGLDRQKRLMAYMEALKKIESLEEL